MVNLLTTVAPTLMCYVKGGEEFGSHSGGVETDTLTEKFGSHSGGVSTDTLTEGTFRKHL